MSITIFDNEDTITHEIYGSDIKLLNSKCIDVSVIRDEVIAIDEADVYVPSLKIKMRAKVITIAYVIEEHDVLQHAKVFPLNTPEEFIESHYQCALDTAISHA